MNKQALPLSLLVLAAFFLLSSISLVEPVSWQTLAKVKFERKYSDVLDEYYWFPVFGEEVQALEGKQVTVSGYVIPAGTGSDLYVLSSNPFSSCFFCGGAGPESVMELNFAGKQPRLYKTNEWLTFTGTLQLNRHDVLRMTYVLNAATLKE